MIYALLITIICMLSFIAVTLESICNNVDTLKKKVNQLQIQIQRDRS